MDDATLLRRNVAELRSLLDLSYSRERALISHVATLLNLLDGAAVAPDRAAELEPAVAAAKETLKSLQQYPVLNHGLFADYARVSAEHRAAMTLNATLTATLNQAQQQVTTTTVELNSLRLRVLEAEAVREAISKMLNRPDLIDPVTAAVRELMQARAGAKKS